MKAVPETKERRYRKEPFSRAELKRLLDGMDDWHDAINTRHKIAKTEGWADKPPSLTKFVAAAVEEPNLLRRPLIRRGKRVIYSRDEKTIRAFLK